MNIRFDHVAGLLKAYNAGTFTLALLERAQTFTVQQVIATTVTNVIPLSVQAPSGMSAVTQEWRLNSVRRAYINLASAASQFGWDNVDLGTSIGTTVILGRNSNGSTPAAGNLRIVERGGTEYYIWVDNTGDLRIGTTAPTNANDTSGTVVGDQTSWIGLKENIEPAGDPAELLRAVLAVELYNYQLIDDGRRNTDGSKPTYTGIVIDQEDRNSNAWYATNLAENQTPVLNERNLFGYLIGAIQAQQKQIDELKQRLAAMEGEL